MKSPARPRLQCGTSIEVRGGTTGWKFAANRPTESGCLSRIIHLEPIRAAPSRRLRALCMLRIPSDVPDAQLATPIWTIRTKADLEARTNNTPDLRRVLEARTNNTLDLQRVAEIAAYVGIIILSECLSAPLVETCVEAPTSIATRKELCAVRIQHQQAPRTRICDTLLQA